MTKFRDGDRVTPVENNEPNDLRVGMVGTVLTTSVDRTWPGEDTEVVSVKWDNARPDSVDTWECYARRLKLAQVDTVSYPIAFKPLLDAAIAAASAKRELAAQDQAALDWKTEHEKTRQKAYKASSRATDHLAQELARAAKL